MNKFILTFAALVIVASLASVTFLSLNDANSRNVRLAKNLDKLQDDFDTLQTKYYVLMGNYSSLDWNYTRLLLQNPALAPNPGDSGIGNDTYLSRLEALQALYNNLKSTYDQYVADYQKLRSLTDQRLMRGNIRDFITSSDLAVVSLTYNITGKTGNTTDPNSYWKDIKAIYDWVNTNIKYREDGLYPILPQNPEEIESDGLLQTNQMGQFPNETLTLRMGDCEDTAALLASMVKAYFSDQFMVECIWITGETAGHVAVQIPFAGSKLVILDPIRDYYSHDTLGNIALNSVSTEIYNWMNIWRPSLGNDIHVYRIFSDYMDKYFDTTEEYVTWMYNR
jgi:hypothetical protein